MAKVVCTCCEIEHEEEYMYTCPRCGAKVCAWCYNPFYRELCDHCAEEVPV